MNYVDPTGLWRTVALGYQAEYGDTLWGLSEKLFGNGSYWRDLGYPYDPQYERGLRVGDIIAYEGGLVEYENGQVNIRRSNILYQNGAYYTPAPMPEPPKPEPVKPAPPSAASTPKPNTGTTPKPSTSSPGNGGGVTAQGMSTGGTIFGGGQTHGYGAGRNLNVNTVRSAADVEKDIRRVENEVKRTKYQIANLRTPGVDAITVFELTRQLWAYKHEFMELVYVSSACVDFIADYEGGFLSEPYNDGYGNPTIGFGHLIQPGEVFSSISREDALNILKNDLLSAVTRVKNYSKSIGVAWNQNEFDALVSVSFNSGNGVKRIIDNLVSGQDPVSAFTWYYTIDRAKRGDLGLWRRRMDEADMFLYGTYTRTYRNP